MKLEAKIYKPHEYENIDAFDYDTYLENQNITVIGYVIISSQIKFEGISAWYLPKRLRYYLSNYIKAQLENNQAKPLALALLIGEKYFSDSKKATLYGVWDFSLDGYLRVVYWLACFDSFCTR